jgi:dipeptidase D
MGILKNKKKIVLVIAGIVLIIACIVCGVLLINKNKIDEPSLDEIVEDKIAAYSTDLADSLESLDSTDKVASYLLNWAENKNISAASDENNNVIYSLKASSKDLKSVTQTVIACEYDASDMSSYIEPIALCLTVAKNTENHGAFKVIFMPRENGEMTGADSLASKYLKDDSNVFYVGKSGSSKAAITTGGYQKLVITDKLKRTSPKYDTAYKISISGIPSQAPGTKMGQLPNAIKTLGNLLANFKSTSLLFELSSFSGGTSADAIPSSANMTVVVNEADTEKLTNKLDNAIEKFNSKYAEDYPELSYTYEEVKVPKKVFTKKETENIVSLMYTATNGVYNKDDDGNVTALTNIGKISTKNSKLDIELCLMSTDGELMEELHETYKTIAGLCDVKLKLEKSYDIYSGGGKASALLTSFEESFLEYSGDSEMVNESAVETTPLSVFAEKNESLGMVYLAVTEKTCEKLCGSLITFLDQGEE